ncbi:MAG: hypothetical protein H6Q70_2497 [Firmicutes bacterium]|nr:hypothetical protein [Bacillota bacterium]
MSNQVNVINEAIKNTGKKHVTALPVFLVYILLTKKGLHKRFLKPLVKPPNSINKFYSRNLSTILLISSESFANELLDAAVSCVEAACSSVASSFIVKTLYMYKFIRKPINLLESEAAIYSAILIIFLSFTNLTLVPNKRQSAFLPNIKDSLSHLLL